MNKQKHNLTFVLLFIGLFLMGQAAVLVHAEAHPFHDSQQSCEVFVAAGQTDQALFTTSVPIAVVKHHAITLHYGKVLYPIQTGVYDARAPPIAG